MYQFLPMRKRVLGVCRRTVSMLRGLTQEFVKEYLETGEDRGRERGKKGGRKVERKGGREVEREKGSEGGRALLTGGIEGIERP